MVATFLTRTPLLLAELHGAVAAQAPEQQSRAAHSLKTSCQLLGATRLAEALQTLEALGRAGSLADATQLADIDRHYQRVRQVLQLLAPAA